MKTVKVEIQGVSSLLQHRFSEGDHNGKQTRKALIKPKAPREEAEAAVYRHNGSFYHPGAAISRLLREAGSGHKLTGTRKSLKFIVPSAVTVLEDCIDILDNGKHAKKFEVDSRPVVIPSTKGRIMRHRPRFDTWGMKFSLEIDDETLPVDTVHLLLEEGGRKLGIGDFRPEKGGPFGRFAVVKWEVA